MTPGTSPAASRPEAPTEGKHGAGAGGAEPPPLPGQDPPRPPPPCPSPSLPPSTPCCWARQAPPAGLWEPHPQGREGGAPVDGEPGRLRGRWEAPVPGPGALLPCSPASGEKQWEAAQRCWDSGRSPSDQSESRHVLSLTASGRAALLPRWSGSSPLSAWDFQPNPILLLPGSRVNIPLGCAADPTCGNALWSPLASPSGGSSNPVPASAAGWAVTQCPAGTQACSLPRDAHVQDRPGLTHTHREKLRGRRRHGLCSPPRGVGQGGSHHLPGGRVGLGLTPRRPSCPGVPSGTPAPSIHTLEDVHPKSGVWL